MTANETELIEIIRNDKDPVEAMITAFKIISDYLAQPQSSQEQIPDDLPVFP